MAITAEQRQRALKLRAAIDVGITAAKEQPSAINGMLDVIRPWHPGPFERGDVRMYADIPRFCKQPHDSTGNEAWNPTDAPALWGHYHGTTPETARPFEADSANVYRLNEYATEGGHTFRNLYDNNVYPPSVMPERWEKVAV